MEKSYNNCPLKKRPVYLIEDNNDHNFDQPIDLSINSSNNKYNNNNHRINNSYISEDIIYYNNNNKTNHNYLDKNSEYQNSSNINFNSSQKEHIYLNKFNDQYPNQFQELNNNNNNQRYEEKVQGYEHIYRTTKTIPNQHDKFYLSNKINDNEPEDLSTSYYRKDYNILTDSSANIQRQKIDNFINKSNILGLSSTNPSSPSYYQCQRCNKCYSTYSGLMKHEEVHKGLHITNYNTPSNNLNGQQITITQNDNNTTIQRYQCPNCGKSYSTYSGLTKHQQFHCPASEGNHNKKLFNCKNCDKVYVSLGALKMHIRTHTLPCKCPLCGKAFSRPWLLQGHIRTHTGEKPFSCQHCHRAFADRSNLRAHLQTHSDIKKYSCNNCTKTFSRMSLLSKHIQGGCTGIQINIEQNDLKNSSNYKVSDYYSHLSSGENYTNRNGNEDNQWETERYNF